METVKLIYLHGFNSSPDSFKARVLCEYLQHKFTIESDDKLLNSYIEVPVIPPVPAEAAELLCSRVESAQKNHVVALAGSSMGGFYATWLAEEYGVRAVLINPAVRPHDLLKKYLGENTNYHTDERWVLDESHIEQLRKLDVEPVTRPERYLLMLQKGDETLDYRQAAKKYSACQSIIEEGGNHSFENFERHIGRLLDFCGIS